MNLKNLNWLFAITAFSILNGCSKEPNFNHQAIVSGEVSKMKLESNLVAWYTFDGDLKDHSGNSNDIIFNSAVPVAGKKGLANTAFKFDGSSSFMQVANSPSLQGIPGRGITLVALVKVDGFFQGECHGNRILQKGEDKDFGLYSLGFDDQLYWADTKNFCDQPVAQKYENFYGSVGYNNLKSYADARGGSYIVPGKWYTVVYSYDPKLNISELYINNQEPIVVKHDATVSYNANSKDLYIGRMENELFPYWFNGVIDEIRIYNSVLSPKEADFVYKSINN